MKMKYPSRLRGIPVLAAALCFLSGGAFLTTDLRAESQSGRQAKVDEKKALDEKRAEESPARAEDLSHAFALSNAFKQVARSIRPSVVHIRVVYEIAGGQQGQQDPFGDRFQSPFDDEFFRRFFGDQAPELFQMPEGPREIQGQGSGVIVHADGYILTNNHVVADASSITVVLSDDREFKAEVVGRDPEMDLAVVKIDAETLPAAPFGDSEALEVGEWVLAIGSPFGLDQTVTAGIVSATGRNVGVARFENFIQTDAAINPGNSGGPLVNLYGQLVGINTAISTRSGGYMGVGFAIPGNAVEDAFQSILETGSVKRGWLGVQMQELDDVARKSFEFEGSGGVLMARVFEDTPAARAGVQDADIVLEVDGDSVSNQTELLNAIAQHAPGETVEMKIFREGKTLSLDVTLGERDLDLMASLDSGMSPRGGGRWGGEAQVPSEFGMTVVPLTAEMAEQLRATDLQGVVVISVERASAAARAGLRPRDIITAVGKETIESVEEFVEVLKGADTSQVVRLKVRRQEAQMFLFLDLSDQDE